MNVLHNIYGTVIVENARRINMHDHHMNHILSKATLIILPALLIGFSSQAQRTSLKVKDAMVYGVKIENLGSQVKQEQISSLLTRYSDRILSYEFITGTEQVDVTIKNDENILNLLEVFSANGYTAWYTDNENNRVVSSGKGYTEKFPEK